MAKPQLVKVEALFYVLQHIKCLVGWYTGSLWVKEHSISDSLKKTALWMCDSESEVRAHHNLTYDTPSFLIKILVEKEDFRFIPWFGIWSFCREAKPYGVEKCIAF